MRVARVPFPAVSLARGKGVGCVSVIQWEGWIEGFVSACERKVITRGAPKTTIFLQVEEFGSGSPSVIIALIKFAINLGALAAGDPVLFLLVKWPWNARVLEKVFYIEWKK